MVGVAVPRDAFRAGCGGSQMVPRSPGAGPRLYRITVKSLPQSTSSRFRSPSLVEHVLCAIATVPRELLCSARGLHHKASTALTVRVELFNIGSKGVCRSFLDEAYMHDHRHLLDNEGPPESVRIQIAGVSQECLGRDIFQADGMEWRARLRLTKYS